MSNIKRIINISVRASQVGLNIEVNEMTNDTIGRHYHYAIRKLGELELNEKTKEVK